MTTLSKLLCSARNIEPDQGTLSGSCILCGRETLEAETDGIIDKYGYLYIGKEFAGKRGKGLVERDNIIKDDLSSQKDNS